MGTQTQREGCLDNPTQSFLRTTVDDKDSKWISVGDHSHCHQSMWCLCVRLFSLLCVSVLGVSACVWPADGNDNLVRMTFAGTNTATLQRKWNLKENRRGEL